MYLGEDFGGSALQVGDLSSVGGSDKARLSSATEETQKAFSAWLGCG
jgi:hypothetical protein